MLNFGASKPRVREGLGPPGPPLDPHLTGNRKRFIMGVVLTMACSFDYKNVPPQALEVN